MIYMTIIASETSFTAETLIPALYVFALAAFLGYQVISRVPPLLHTPLMSATNAISGISLVGSIVTAGAQYNMVSTILGVTAVTCATINVVGGFMITDRMLRMFKRRIPAGKETKEIGTKESKKLTSGDGDGAKP
jgi:H+-translocating NAD(P) transhydrogenase subunit alpha